MDQAPLTADRDEFLARLNASLAEPVPPEFIATYDAARRVHDIETTVVIDRLIEHAHATGRELTGILFTPDEPYEVRFNAEPLL